MFLGYWIPRTNTIVWLEDGWFHSHWTLRAITSSVKLSHFHCWGSWNRGPIVHWVISLQTLTVSLSLLVVLDRALLVPKCATCQYKSPLRSSLSATDIFLPGFTSSLVFATFFLHPAISSSSSQVLIFIIIFLLILGHLSLVSSLIHSFKHLSNSTKF